MGNMRRRFWIWVHGTAERVWHWTYYRHLAPPAAPPAGPHSWSVTYIDSKGHTVEWDGHQTRHHAAEYRQRTDSTD